MFVLPRRRNFLAIQLGCLSSSYITSLKQKQPDLLDQVRALSPAGAIHHLLSNLSPASSAADTSNIQKLPFLEDSFDPCFFELVVAHSSRPVFRHLRVSSL